MPAALRTASPGDSLLLAPGVYRGSFELRRGVSLLSLAGPDSTILDGDGSRYVLLGRWIDSTTVIAGLTIRNGRRDHPNSGGGGIYLYQSSPRVIGNIFRDHLGYFGAGVYMTYGCRAIVAFNRFEANEAHLGGAVAAYLQCAPLVYANVFEGNRAGSGGAALFMNSSGVLRENIARGNASPQGTAVYFDSSPVLLVGNQFDGGEAAFFALDDDAPYVLLPNGAPPKEPRQGGVDAMPSVPDSVVAEWRDWIRDHPPPP